jgi:hypothetical protein
MNTPPGSPKFVRSGAPHADSRMAARVTPGRRRRRRVYQAATIDRDRLIAERLQAAIAQHTAASKYLGR